MTEGDIEVNSADMVELAYKEYFSQYRHLNEQMNKIPPLAVTLTGGFWYVAVIVESYGNGLETAMEAFARFGLMVFAGIANFALILIAIRIRGVMKGYQDRLKEFAPTLWPDSSNQRLFGSVDFSMISIYASLMLSGTIMSLIGAFVLYWPQTQYPLWAGIIGVALAALFLFFLSIGLPKWLMRSGK